MAKRIELEVECSDCAGTGVYCGFMEPKGIGVVCLGCNGTGKAYFTYYPFTRKKGKRGIKEVSLLNGKSIVCGGPKNKRIPYNIFKKALTEKEVEELFK